MIQRKLTKNKSSCILTISKEIMTLLGYKDNVWLEIDSNKNIILRKENSENGKQR